MAHKTLSVICAGFGWGAGSPQTELGPQRLLDLGLAPSLREIDPNIVVGDVLSPIIKALPHAKLEFKERLTQVANFCQRLASTVYEAKSTHFPVILGGDHSIAIGTWSGLICALQAKKQFGLIWIDAHMDSHTEHTSLSQNIHGMPLAALLGHGLRELVNVHENEAKLDPAHVVLIGIRSFEEAESQLLVDLNVKVFYMHQVKERGFESIFQEALKHVSQNTKGFGISIDLDGFDPIDAPGTGTQEPDGIQPIEVIACLSQIKDNHQFKALEIVEFDPSKDIDDKSAQLVQNLIKSII